MSLSPGHRFLILADRFPPHGQVGGRRPYYFARHLTDLGHHVSVVTADRPVDPAFSWNVDIGFLEDRFAVPIRTADTPGPALTRAVLNQVQHGASSALATRLAWKFGMLALPPHFQARWRWAPHELVERLGPIDTVIASAGPWCMLEYGAEMKHRLGARLVYDYRDLWVARDPAVGIQSLHDHGSGLVGRLVRRRLMKIEERLIIEADGFVTVSEALAGDIRSIPGAPPGRVVYNGFDRAENPREPDPPHPDAFRLVFAGNLREEQRIDRFLEAVTLAFERRPDIRDTTEVWFVGAKISRPHLVAMIEEHAHAERLHVTDFLPRQEAAALSASAHALLQFSFEGKRGIVSSKITQYLALDRPIFLVSNVDDCMEEIVRRTRAGVIARTVDDMAEALVSMHDQWRDTGAVVHEPDEAAVEEYGFRRQIERFSDFVAELHSTPTV